MNTLLAAATTLLSPQPRRRVAGAIIRPVSQTAFYIEGTEPFERAIRESVKWMSERVEIPADAFGGEPFRVGAGAAFSAEAIAIRNDQVKLWAATLEDRREASSHGRTWITEVTVGQTGNVGA